MKPEIIADTTYIHQGNVKYLKDMVDQLACIKCDTVKFHLLFNIDDYMLPTHPAYDKVKKMLITQDDWDSVIERAVVKGLNVLLLCDDMASLEYAIEKDIGPIELHSSALTDYKMLKKAGEYKGDVMLGIGGGSVSEIETALKTLNKPATLMYGFNRWSTKPEDIHFERMRMISEQFGLPMGYADHTNWKHSKNVLISLQGVAMGYPIIEKHYTLKPGVRRVDYKESVGKKTLELIKEDANYIWSLRGDESMSEAEVFFRDKIRKVDGKRQ